MIQAKWLCLDNFGLWLVVSHLHETILVHLLITDDATMILQIDPTLTR